MWKRFWRASRSGTFERNLSHVLLVMSETAHWRRCSIPPWCAPTSGSGRKGSTIHALAAACVAVSLPKIHRRPTSVACQLPSISLAAEASDSRNFERSSPSGCSKHPPNLSITHNFGSTAGPLGAPLVRGAYSPGHHPVAGRWYCWRGRDSHRACDLGQILVRGFYVALSVIMQSRSSTAISVGVTLMRGSAVPLGRPIEHRHPEDQPQDAEDRDQIG